MFDVGWTLFDEDFRWFKTCNWMSETLRAYDINIPPECVKIQYEAACARPDPYINSITKQCLLELGLQDDVVKTLCKKHPWHTYDFYPYLGARSLLQELQMMGVKVGVLSNQGKFTRNVLEKHNFLILCDFVLLSDEVGLSKPSKEFFELALKTANVFANDTLYVGDRLDHDVAGAAELDIDAALVMQGPHRMQKVCKHSPKYTFDSIMEVLNAIRADCENVGRVQLINK